MENIKCGSNKKVLDDYLVKIEGRINCMIAMLSAANLRIGVSCLVSECEADSHNNGYVYRIKNIDKKLDELEAEIRAIVDFI